MALIFFLKKKFPFQQHLAVNLTLKLQELFEHSSKYVDSFQGRPWSHISLKIV
jgi:hypothetical protein